ncbi:nuclear transport factor 2 family protein [Novosphingobium flavum]|uniref:Nuclear transport factor 2 family protein n=1 Tax=Novosphingobium flavum TaxID=1778672 RepID=A0A7X1FSN0_9SPHN|nr:nuclear transport factor 2 family protein [Novosphingobium flavum]MBC2666114.1 nuclear transport factor 2 family protein [Novosphingobium flavum]
MTPLLRLAAMPLMIALAAPAVHAAAPSEMAALAKAEDAYARAVSGGDLAALAQTLSDDLVYVHASGQVQDKSQYLQGTADAGFPVRSARVIERNVEIAGRIGVIVGIIGYDVGKGENPARYLAVYRKEHGRWLLLRWQNTRLAQAGR